MKQILLFGAGKSATVLIDYLLSHAKTEHWSLIVVDTNLQLASGKIKDSPFGKAISFDVTDSAMRGEIIQQSSLVISMLPPALHLEVAKDCIQFSKHLLTASYVDDAMRSLATEIRNKDIVFLCEMGLDPGIDHMSAMKLIDDIHSKGGKVTSFKSHCGGLVAPESDDNSWHYKISWNPRNVVMAGKAGAYYREDGVEKRLNHEELFATYRFVDVPEVGKLCWYPNRDSLSYAPLYGLNNVPTMIRTTLRHQDFMYGWRNMIDLKLTEEEPLYDTGLKTLKEVFGEHMIRNGLRDWMNLENTALTLRQLSNIGFDDNSTQVNRGMFSPADLLQFALEQKLALKPGDKDMIVMLHEFEFMVQGHPFGITSSLVVIGEDNLHTAMAKTVGLPLAIATKLILTGRLTLTGLQIPVSKEIYQPVLKELEEYGIRFHEETRMLD
jgi:saccharopine dehydrogenase (NADP+, L-glutamate forming)